MGKRFSLVCCTAAFLMVLSACGQRGPLFLPEDTEAASAASEQPADEGQESSERDEDKEGAGR